MCGEARLSRRALSFFCLDNEKASAEMMLPHTEAWLCPLFIALNRCLYPVIFTLPSPPREGCIVSAYLSVCIVYLSKSQILLDAITAKILFGF